VGPVAVPQAAMENSTPLMMNARMARRIGSSC
jgi:hypothetical protein